jgi:TetR/AcrR family transcriptional regulator, repressor of fatR-cypB operon
MLSAARTVFAEKGFGGATLEEIAVLAEFGKGTLYNYFPGGKDEILFAVFDELYDDLEQIIRDSFPEVGPSRWKTETRERFSKYIAGCFEYFEARYELFLILTKEAHRMCFSENTERLHYFLAQRSRITDAIASQVDRAIQAGAMRPLPPHAVAHMIFGNISGLQLQRALSRCNQDCQSGTGSPPEAQSSAEFLCSFLFDGLLTDQSPPAHAHD